MQNFDTLAFVVALFFAFPLYFMPSFIAAKKEHPARRKILLWNLLTGWTLIGLAVTLIWSCWDVKNEPTTEE